VAEEQEATGIRLLDMIDVHWYPSESANATLLQLHRVFYDRSYSYPGANGVKAVNGAWDNSITQEYIFQRIGDWLTEYFGVNHGITIGLTEIDFPSSDPNIISVVYASMLGTFAENGVEIFSPWSWKTGMWETMHLFSRYSKSISVSTTSSLDATLSGYSTINSNADSMTIILVNRDLSSSRTANVNISGFALPDGNYSTLELSSLPANETFVSHTSNALESGTVNLTGNSFNITLPSVSTTAVILTKTGTGIVQNTHDSYGAQSLKLLPNPAKNAVRIEFLNEQPVTSGVIVYNQDGRQIDACNWEYSGLSPLTINTENYHEGTYFVKVTNRIFTETRKLIIVK